MERIFVFLCALVCSLTRATSATPLTIMQGRILGASELKILPVARIATVEISGEDHERPTYYFDCISNQNNGSGLRWTRRNGRQRFDVQPLHSGTPGIRMLSGGIGSSDLDVYTCADDYSDDVAVVNITDSNPGINAAEDMVEVVQGLTVELEVYVSGYPVPTESQIRWQRPDQSIITSSDQGVSFQAGGKRMILSNVRADQAGLYECIVTVLTMSAFVKIRLNVYVAPVILTHPSEITDAMEYSPVTLTCSASGIPPPLIQWERESGEPLPVDAQQSTSEAGNTTTTLLELRMVRYEDRGRYRCVANNVHTNSAMSNYTDIRVTPALLLVDEQSQIVEDLHFAEEGSSVRLECLGTGNLKWRSSTGLDVSSSDLENIYQSYDPTRDALTLVIVNFTSINTATYTCMTNLNDAHNTPLEVSIFITSSNPAVIIHSRVQFVLPGNITTLMARVYASVSPANLTRVNWYHEGRLIDDVNEERYTARSDGEIYQLELNSVSENELGKYEIVVSLNQVNATDTIHVRFPEPPSANVTPSSVTVNEGEEVSLFCEAGGSGLLNVSWTMADGSPLPLGVQENGNEIFIARASSLHPGKYVCSVKNLAGTSQDSADVTVFYSPTAVITYNQSTSAPNQPLYLVFDHGAPGPTVVCSGEGYLPPILQWVQQNGRDLPHGIFQTSQPNGDVHLQWLRPMEFTDSRSYSCQASNRNGNNTATVEVLVQISPRINSIYPFSSSIKPATQTFTYIVPLNYVGTTLVCTASGYPAPEVEWHKDGLRVPINDDVVSENVTMSATTTAKLTWRRYFRSSDTASYQCIVRKPNTDVEIASQTIYLKAENSTIANPPEPCSVQDRSINFQIRVLGTGCANWDSEQTAQIATEFRDELLNIVQTECSCQIGENELEILGLPQCSNKVNSAAVFRGRIDTSLQTKTEQLFCALSSWQQKSPLIRINGRFQAIDTSCPLESSGSEECVVPSSVFSFTAQAVIIGVTVVVVIAIVAIVVAILLICCLPRYWHKRKRGFDVTDRMNDHTYSRTDAFSRYSSRGRVGPLNPTPSEAYSTLSPGSRDSPLQFSDTIALGDAHSGSNENLISPEGVADDTVQGQPRSRPPLAANGYEIPLISQENLVSVGLDSNGDCQTAAKKHTNSASGKNSSNVVSPVTTTSTIPHTSQSSSNDNSSRQSNVQNPQWQYYEDAFSPDPSSSFRNSPTISGRVAGPGPQQNSNYVPTAHTQQNSRFGGSLFTPTDGTRSSSSLQVAKQAFMSQFQSMDSITHLSGRESEPPPPYSSRTSSEFVLDRDDDDSSMMDNGAYEGTNRLQRPWYQDSGPPVVSRYAVISPATSQTTNSTVERLHPYAMIQNEHIPIHSLTNQTSVTGQSTSVLTTRRVSNHQRPSLPNGTSTSTLC